MGLFSNNVSPVAIDFGSSSVKVLQLGEGQTPTILAAGQLDLPDSARTHPEKMLAFLALKLPELLNEARVKGKRAVIALPGVQTFMGHMQVASIEGASTEDLLKSQLALLTGCSAEGVVVRAMPVEGKIRTDTICLAMSRDLVMQFVEMLRKIKLSVVGVHTDALAMVRAFDYLHQRQGDENLTTLYVDMGWGGTRVTIAHGTKMVFARGIHFGGNQFDQQIARTLNCDIEVARRHRLALRSPGSGEDQMARNNAPTSALLSVAAKAHAAGATSGGAAVMEEDRRSGQQAPGLGMRLDGIDASEISSDMDLGELLETMSDELAMCLRYHDAMFPSRDVGRIIFLGGEARQTWLCQHIVKSLRINSQLGDPLARLRRDGLGPTPGVDFSQPQPGWAVTCGLCSAPTDL